MLFHSSHHHQNAYLAKFHISDSLTTGVYFKEYMSPFHESFCFPCVCPHRKRHIALPSTITYSAMYSRIITATSSSYNIEAQWCVLCLPSCLYFLLTVVVMYLFIVFTRDGCPKRLLLLPDSDAILAFPCSCDGIIMLEHWWLN